MAIGGTATIVGTGTDELLHDFKQSLLRRPHQRRPATAVGGRIDRTRPVCPYPQVARYRGTGSIDEAANFTCSAATPPPVKTTTSGGTR